MSAEETIERLTDLVVRQAAIIKAQSDALLQLGAVVMEEERAAAAAQYEAMLGPSEYTEKGGDRA